VKKLIIAVFVVLGLIVFSVPSVMATPYYRVKILDGTGPYPGGEFIIQPLDNSLDGVIDNYSSLTSTSSVSFDTFCVEQHETIGTGQTYDATIDDGAIKGGTGGNPDPISVGTAWLYSQFARGTLADYEYETGRLDSAGFLQETIWYLEQEITSYNLSNPFMLAVIDKFGNITNAMSDENGEYGVQALNLYTFGHAGDEAFAKQSQLIYVPDASIMWLLGPAFIMLGLLGRKKEKEYL
jgi:hypothetical protein